MKNVNLEQLRWWFTDVDYLVSKFEEVIEQLEIKFFEISNQYAKLKSQYWDVIFQFFGNRYGSGRTLVDIILSTERVVHARIS